jgi:nicotinamide phosphoribosyltransferase
VKFDFISLCDGYKLDHRRQYPRGTTNVFSNWTPRATRVPGQNAAVFFDLQYFLQAYFVELAQETFFGVRKDTVLKKYQRRVDKYLGPNDIGVDHIAALHELGYIPLEFRAVREGTLVPLRVPMFTCESTHYDFAWTTNYFESLESNILWKGCTSATTAFRFRKMLMAHAQRSGDPAFVDYQGHDFSFRGMSGPEDSALSGAGHALSFLGSDTFGPVFDLVEGYYGCADNEPLIVSVAATEHSVMCAGGQEDEIETYMNLMNLYKTGILSIVSDTWDLWEVCRFLPKLKDRIMARDGKIVIRPDSGDPADILCGDAGWRPLTPNAALTWRDEMIQKGLVEVLWDIFGGTINEKGYKVLDPHIGAIYGDSINYERGDDIAQRLQAKGFASTNVVFGLGSYTYEYVTRDTYGFAMKATAATVNGTERMLFKDPKTDSGTKKSLKGRIVVLEEHGELVAHDQLTRGMWQKYNGQNKLELVWRNGVFHRRQSFENVRQVLRGYHV